MKTADDIRPGKKAVLVQADDKLSEAIGCMAKDDAEEALVFSGKEFVGALSHFMMLRSRLNADEDKAAGFTISSARPDKGTPADWIANQMLDCSIRALPVFAGDKLKKIIGIYGLLDALSDEKELDAELKYAVEPKKSLSHDDKLGKAIHMMHSEKIKEILLTDDDGKPAGIVSSSSIIRNYHLQHTSERQHGETPDTPEKTHQTEQKQLLSLKLKNFAEKNISRIDKSAKVSEAAKLAAKERRALILAQEGGEPAGVIYAERLLKRIVELISAAAAEEALIQFKGMSKLNLDDNIISEIKNISEEQGEKLQRYFKNRYDMEIHVKQREKEGAQSRYTINSRIIYPGATVAAQAEDWDIITALRKSMDKLESQLESMYKGKPEGKSRDDRVRAAA